MTLSFKLTNNNGKNEVKFLLSFDDRFVEIKE